MKKSIRFYFFTAVGTVLVAAVLVMGFIQTYLAVEYFKKDKEALLQQVVLNISSGAREGEIDIRHENIYTIEYMANVVDAKVFIVAPDGQVKFSTDSTVMPGIKLSPKVMEAVQQNKSFKDMGKLDGLLKTNHYVAVAPFQGDDGVVSGYVFAVSDASSLSMYLSDMVSSFLLSAGVVLLVASIIALLLTNWVTVPIRKIAIAARRFGEGEYSARVPVEGYEELAQLAVTFNEMANSFEATDLSRRSFMGNIAHELRTPMTTIKGFIDGILDGTIPEAEREKYLAIVSEEVGRLARLTKNMLDVSRLEAGEYTAQATVFDIWKPIVSVLAGAEQRLQEQNILIADMMAEQPVYAMADEDFVHQILFNLVDNAIKFTPEGGEISIQVKPQRSMLMVSVRNTGDGIPPETLSHIFDRFYKADTSRGIHTGGSGLGLHICKVLVNMMGGRIWAESKVGEYSEFYFTLPCVTGKQLEKERTNGKEGK